MKSKTTITLSSAAIAAVALLFAGPIVGNQQALAYGWHHGWGWHGGWGWHHGWGWHGGWGWHHGWGWHRPW